MLFVLMNDFVHRIASALGSMTPSILLEPNIQVRHAWLDHIFPNSFDMCIPCCSSCHKERREMLVRISASIVGKLRYNFVALTRTSIVGCERLNSCSDSKASKACLLSTAFRFVTAFLSSVSNVLDSAKTFARTLSLFSASAWWISAIDEKECTAMPDPRMRYP